MFIMTYLTATRFGSMVEKTRTFKAESIYAARTQADRFMAAAKAKGLPIYPTYDLQQEKAA